MSDDVTRYLTRLAVGSRRSMRAALDRIAAALGIDDASLVVWHELTPDDVAEATAQLRDVYAPRSAAQSAAALRGVLRVAAASRPTFEASRLVDAIVRARGSRELAGRAPTLDEIKALAIAASRTSTPHRDAAALALLCGGGLRRREASELYWRDVRHACAAVHVIGKGNRERTVALAPGADLALHALREYTLERVFGSDYSERVRFSVAHDVIADRSVLELSPEGLYALVCRLARDAGLEHLSPHDLRRGYASEQIDTSGDPMAVARNMGHASVATTFGYDRRPERAAIAAARSMVFTYVPPATRG